MKILVTVKRVTDPDVTVKLLPDGSGVDTSNVDHKINNYDEYALEAALRLREKYTDQFDEVVVLGVGDSASTKELRTALAMGADRAVLVDCDDSAFDTSVAADVIAAAIKDEAPDLVLMGKLAVDGENTQVPQMVSHRLGWGQGCFALEIDLDGDAVALTCQADGGLNRLKVKLPALVSYGDMPDEDVRYASLPGIMKAKRKPFKTVSLSDLGVEPSPKVRIVGYSEPPKRDAGVILETVDDLMDRLQNEAKVI